MTQKTKSAAAATATAFAAMPRMQPEPVEESRGGFRIYKPAAKKEPPADTLPGKYMVGAITAIVHRETEAAVESIVRDAIRRALAETAKKKKQPRRKRG